MSGHFNDGERSDLGYLGRIWPRLSHLEKLLIVCSLAKRNHSNLYRYRVFLRRFYTTLMFMPKNKSPDLLRIQGFEDGVSERNNPAAFAHDRST